MPIDVSHIVDPYAYAVLLACAEEERTRSRLYVSNAQKRKFEAMLDAGWLRMDGRIVRLTDPGFEAMELMKRLLGELHDDSWRTVIEDIDWVRGMQGDRMREVMRERRAGVTERREGE